MAKPNRKPAQKVTTQKAPDVLVHDLTLVSPDRNRKDMQTLKTGIIAAEQIMFPNRSYLYDLYHDVRSIDGFLQGIIQKRIDNVLNKTLRFKNKDGKENQEVTDLMRSDKGRDLITLMLESKIEGVSGVEFKIGPELAFKEIPRKHIKPEKKLITKSQYSVSEADGYKYEELPMVWVMGKERDLGLLLGCAMYSIYKRGTLGDFAQFIEIFGQPVRIIYYDAYDTKTKIELKQILDEAGSSLAMMIPKQAQFEMMDGKTSNGDGKLQESLLRYCDEMMSIAILGNTQTTSSSRGSGYAQSKEHAKQQEQITASDLIFCEGLLNSKKFLAILQSYGFDVAGGRFEYELELNLANLKLRMEIDMFVSTKVPVSDDYWYDTYGIPKPDNYDELKQKMEERLQRMEELAAAVPKNPEIPKNPKIPVRSKTPDLMDLERPGLRRIIGKYLADFFDPARP